MLKLQSNEWAIAKLTQGGFEDFKIAYMPVLMNITPDGINNNELADQARVTKQAMSKVAKELQKRGYIRSTIDTRDKRSTVIMLTDRGKKLVIEARMHVTDLCNEYRALVGRTEFDKATEILKAIMVYNDQKLLAKK